MDIFIEQLVTKKVTGIDLLKKIGILAGGLVLSITLLIISSMFGMAQIGLLFDVGIVYLCIILLRNTSIEYEYIVTNSDLDIDKISGKSKRKRLITAQINTFEDFGKYTEEVNVSAAATVEVTDGTGVGAYYAVFKHNKLGKVLLLFTPNERLLENIIKALPHSLRHKFR